MILIISLFSIVFWMGFEQSGRDAQPFADEKTDRTIFGYDVPGVGLPGRSTRCFIITLAPAVRDPLDIPGAAGSSRSRRSPRRAGPDPARRRRSWSCTSPSEDGQVGQHGLAALADLGLLHLHARRAVPLARSACRWSTSSPPRGCASLMMAVWFLCTAIGNYSPAIMEQTAGARYHSNLWAFLGVHGARARAAPAGPDPGPGQDVPRPSLSGIDRREIVDR